jgi:hypothetical protein
MSTWTSSVPPIPPLEGVLTTPRVVAGQSAADLPTWLARVLVGLEAFQTELDRLPEPTRLSYMVAQRLAHQGLLAGELHTLPVETSVPVSAGLEGISQGVPGAQLQPFGWWASEGPAVLRVQPAEPINQLSVTTFGESWIRVESPQGDTGWVGCPWARSLPLAVTSGPLTLTVRSEQRWSGLAAFGLERVTYQPGAVITLGTLARTEVAFERVPSGCEARIEWAETLDGPWFETRTTGLQEEEVVFDLGTNLERTLTRALPVGSTLWLGREGWLFESYVGKLLVDEDPSPAHEAGGPGAWDKIDARVVRRGIVSLAEVTADGSIERLEIPNAPEGLVWRLSALLYALRESEASYQLLAGEEDRVAVALNGAHVPKTPDGRYTLRFRAGLNRLVFYGKRDGTGGTVDVTLGVASPPLSDFRGTHYLQSWYATDVALGAAWPRDAWPQDAGLTRPHAAQRELLLRTSVAGQVTYDPSLLWIDQAGAVSIGHDPGVARFALVRGPAATRDLARVTLRGGGFETPVVKLSQRTW